MTADFEVRRDSGGRWFWTLYFEKNRTVAKSAESFDSRGECLHSIHLARVAAPIAVVFDVTKTARAMVDAADVR